MNNFNKALLILLVIQAIVVGVLYFPREEETISVAPLLPDFAKDQVTALQIEDSDGNTLRLAQDENGAWVLPEADNFPVNSTTVNTLLDKLTGLQTNRLITRSETSHRRLQVAEDEFNRALTLTQGGETTQLYIGSSGGANATHARLAGDDTVYLVSNLAATDTNPQVSSWIDSTYLSAPVADVINLTLQNANGTFTFTRAEGETWQFDGLAGGEVLNASLFQSFLNQATQIRMSEPLGKTEEDSYGLGTPSATLTFTVRTLVPQPAPEVDAAATGEATEENTPEATFTPTATPEPVYEEKTYTLVLGANLTEQNGYVAKSSESDYYVLLAATAAENFTNKTRENFVTVPTATPTPLATETPLASATPAATATLEPSATVAATETPAPSATPLPASPTSASPQATEASN